MLVDREIAMLTYVNPEECDRCKVLDRPARMHICRHARHGNSP